MFIFFVGILAFICEIAATAVIFAYRLLTTLVEFPTAALAFVPALAKVGRKSVSTGSVRTSILMLEFQI